VVEEVQKRGMPTEIALLPMIESAFNPTAYSRSKASGIWQFVPATGKHYGLKQDWWKDNRRDVMAATDAALTYLQKLHVMFGTWELALAAYNAGEGTVQRAIERNRRMGLPTDYQSLQLPAETRNYVPKLQAVKNIVASPEQYGLNIKPIENKPYFTSVPVPAKMDVHVAAKLAGVSVEEFRQLNPAYNRPVINSDTQNILLPIGTEDDFAANLANYNRPLVSWKTHYAKRGEKVGAIAKKYGVSVSQLMDVNDLSRKQRLKANQPLLVPAPGGGTSLPDADTPLAEAEPTAPAEKEKTTRHVVESGDTAYGIARQYGMTTRQLLSLNQLKSSKLKKGQILAVSASPAIQASGKKTRTAQSKADRTKTRYVVKRGETLSSIARKFNVATSDLQRWNKISGSRILPGAKLVIYKPDAA
jgi:membrane-bound lytic murein transglycosylase D